MTQEQLLEQVQNYIDDNLQDDVKMQLVINILDDFSNLFFENGFYNKANELNKIILRLDKLLKLGDVNDD